MTHSPVYIQSIAAIYPENQMVENQLTAQEPDYKQWITDAGLRRRMSRIVKMGVTAGLQCLQSSAMQADAIITATGLGCLADTEKFLKSISEQDEELLSPTPFIQSTFNTIGAQIALITGNKSYNTTYVHRALSFESALLDALMQLQSGEAENILVGAVDELTPTVFQILKRMGAWRKNPAGEGAAFFLLSRTKTDQTIAQILGIDMQSDSTTPHQWNEKRDDFLERHHITNPYIITDDVYKPICGEYHTASAFGLWYACSQLPQNGNILVCNSFLNNHTSVLIKKFDI